MKINDTPVKTLSINAGSPQTRANRTDEKTAQETVSKTIQRNNSASTSDTVSLTSKAPIADSLSKSSGVFDAVKVQEIKSAIAKGTFQVDADKIADGLIDTVKDLIRSPKKG